MTENRHITGMSAVLLPMHPGGGIDWEGFERHLGATHEAGLVPAVNMDTGFGPFLTPDQRDEVLARTDAVLPASAGEGSGSDARIRFVAGAIVDDTPGDALDTDGYARAMEAVAKLGGVPILFPSHGLAAVAEEDLVGVHARLGEGVDRFLGFELGSMFHPAGRIWEPSTYEAMLGVDSMVGAKHSSLRRGPEMWRLGVRDRVRPEFMVLTGNDLAIDMVTHGSDYLLGISTFCPDAFAARDRAWERGDLVRFAELNDLLQYLGQLAFRPPVPGYRHDAAMFLALRGRIGSDRTHPTSPERPASDRDLLADILERLEALLLEE